MATILRQSGQNRGRGFDMGETFEFIGRVLERQEATSHHQIAGTKLGSGAAQIDVKLPITGTGFGSG